MNIANQLRQLAQKAKQEQEDQREADARKERERILAIKMGAAKEGKKFFDQCVAEAKGRPSEGTVSVFLLKCWSGHGGKHELMHHEASWEIALTMLRNEGFTAEVEFCEREENDELGDCTLYSVYILLKW